MHQEKKVALSGVQPTGVPHIGNYFGAMKQFVDLQDEYQLYVFIADYHALTTVHEATTLQHQVHNLILDYLAIGLDPEKVVIYRQVDVPELTELAWIFSTLVTIPWLERAHAYKDKTAKGLEANVGLFTYPILMAADILLPHADIVPVGKDQIQHVEMAREIARKCNAQFGTTFKEPQELVKENVQTVIGTDGQKMSKSYGNTIPLFGSDAEIRKAIMSIVTDSKKPEEVKDPESCNIFALHKLVTPEPQLSEIRSKYEQGGLGYGDAKQMLFKNYISYITPMREKRAYFEEHPGIVRQILDEGAQTVKKLAKDRMKEIRLKVGLSSN